MGDLLLTILVGVMIAAQGVLLMRYAGRGWLIGYGLLFVAGVIWTDWRTDDYSSASLQAMLVTFGLVVTVSLRVLESRDKAQGTHLKRS